jgi:outer membrane protein
MKVVDLKANHMKWMFTGVFLVSLLLGLGPRASAQSLLDLQNEAVANRRLITKYQAEARKGALDIRIARSGYLPSLDTRYVANSLNAATVMATKENSQFTAALSYNIFAGFRDRYNVESAKLVEKSLLFQLQTAVQDLGLQVASLYIDIYGKDHALKVADDEVRLLEKRYEDTQSRFRVGLIRKNDLLKIKVDLDDAVQRRERARTDLEKSVNSLALQTESPINAKALSFAELKDLPIIGKPEAYRSRMLKKRSEIRTLEMLLDARKNQVEVAKAAYYPKVDLSASYTRFGDDYVLGDPTTAGNPYIYKEQSQLSLMVSMNLFDGRRKYDTVRKARLDVRQTQADLHELKQSMNTDLDNVLLDVAVARKNLTVAENSIAQADENLRVTDLSYKEGVETATNVLDAIYYLSRAKLNAINARSDFFLNYFKLVRITDGFAVTLPPAVFAENE